MNEEKIPVSIFYTFATLGLWLIASTLTFSTESLPIFYTNCLCGILLILFGLKSRKGPSAFAIWAITLLGIWLQFSPLVFWAPTAASYINDTFVGIWVIALAITLHPMPGHTLREFSTIPPGWSFNPSAWPQRLPIAFLAFLCWMIARYLSAYQLHYLDTVWDPFFTPGTRAVLESSVSKLFPVSDAGLGALAYTLEFFSACQGGTNRWRTAPWLVLVFGILVIPVSIVSTILIICQPLAVGTWCTLCLVTALCMLSSIPFAIAEVAATCQFLRYNKRKPFFTLLIHGDECPGETPDRKSPSMDAPLTTIFKASLSGITLPWNLVLTALLGISLMATPSVLHLSGALFDFDPILGALVTILSVISFAEYTRKTRHLIPLVSLALLTLTWLFHTQQALPILLYHTAFALAAILLSLRQGPTREKSTFRMK